MPEGVVAERGHMCVSDPLRVAWQAPRALADHISIGYAAVITSEAMHGMEAAGGSGEALRIAGFARVTEMTACYGESVWHRSSPESESVDGLLTMDRSSGPTAICPEAGLVHPANDGHSGRPLLPLEYQRPSLPGAYRLFVYHKDDPGYLAYSSTFTIRPRPDLCGVCGGDGQSCVGCDGVLRSGVVRDACGICGGFDDSCGLPPALGLLPYPTKDLCLQAGSGESPGRAVSQVWWAAESNRSSADFVAVCPDGEARAFSPTACLLVETDLQAPGSGRGRRGVLELDLELTPGVWGLRYCRKTATTEEEEGGRGDEGGADGWSPFELALEFEFNVWEPGNAACRYFPQQVLL